MELEFDFSQNQAPSQGMKVSPRLVAANYILELSSQKLQQAISTELDENPALELMDVPLCNVCGTELQGSICPRCIERQKAPDGSASVDGQSTSYDDLPEQRQRDPDDEDFDPLTRVASEQTLAEKLLMDMGAALPEEDLPIAEYLIGSLDDQGYLAIRTSDVAFEMDVSEDRVKAVLKVLQSLDPVGIGARNLRECLLIQIDHLEERGLSQPHARTVVEQYLTEMGEHKFSRIAHDLKISAEQVADVWEFVKQKLNPHPAHGFSSTNMSDRDTRAMYVIPDVVISATPTGDFEVEVVESRRFVLRINPMYTRLSAELHARSAAMTADEKKHVQQYMGRAKLFISNINQRRQTLFNITRCLVDQQRDYLEKGVRHLRPLSRAAVALELGVHESTVSRATASKYVMLPNGEVIPYAHFFTPSLSIKDIMKEVIEKEGRALTDSQIVERLKENGVHIARRTVAKYRMQLSILPSSLR